MRADRGGVPAAQAAAGRGAAGGREGGPGAAGEQGASRPAPSPLPVPIFTDACSNGAAFINSLRLNHTCGGSPGKCQKCCSQTFKHRFASELQHCGHQEGLVFSERSLSPPVRQVLELQSQLDQSKRSAIELKRHCRRVTSDLQDARVLTDSLQSRAP